MKPVSISENSLPAQIWNSAPQLDNIPVINTERWSRLALAR